MKNDRFSCIYTEDRHEELWYDGGCVYQWCTARHHLDRCQLQAAHRQNEQALLVK